MSNAINYAAGKITHLEPNINVTLGKVVQMDLHPSGKAYDGPAVVVAAYRTNGHSMVELVSIADKAHRLVPRPAAPYAD